MTNLKLLSTYQTEFEAELVRGKLEREGIEAMIESQDRSNMIPSLDYAGGVHLYVEPEDLARAKSIIESTDDDLTDDMEEA
ncbi:MAG TPA: DUF2007 domain-containing protein [Candidatus Kapabacteria bacterium]|nr:DUF2007 domain-containing protein [Candidatus Kapabacteria bacterium]